jgi:hypothetical protein
MERNRTPKPDPIGKQPLMLSQGGLDAALWPWFRRWIENPHNQYSAEWHAIEDKRRFLVLLVVSLVLRDRREAKALKEKAEAVAPVLARRVLPLLRRRISKLTLTDYMAVTRNPSPDEYKFPARYYDKRAKLRSGLKTLPKFFGAP